MSFADLLRAATSITTRCVHCRELREDHAHDTWGETTLCPFSPTIYQEMTAGQLSAYRDACERPWKEAGAAAADYLREALNAPSPMRSLFTVTPVDDKEKL